jgi:hypothetical protein
MSNVSDSAAVNPFPFSARLMVAAQEFFGGKMPSRKKFNQFFGYFSRELGHLTGVGMDAHQLEAVMLGYQHGIQTGRLCGQCEDYLRNLSGGRMIVLIGKIADRYPLACIDDYYQAWRRIAMKGAKIPA